MEDTNTNRVWRKSDSYGKENQSQKQIIHLSNGQQSIWLLSNPMYREIHKNTYFCRVSGRGGRRNAAKRRGEFSRRTKQYWEL